MSGAVRSGDAEVEASEPGPGRAEPRSEGARPRPVRGGSPWPRARVVVGWVLAGVVVGILWRLLSPVAAGWSESYERDLAGDVTLAVLDVLAGVLGAALGLARPGPGSAARFVVVVLGSSAASGVAWQTGRLLGAPKLAMPAVLLLWPLAVAIVTVGATLIASLVLRDPYDEA